jgi:thiosulfate/3-mercaptopyruvate sulfurtransferase
VAPVPASKKFWIFNGSVEQYPSVLTNASVHAGRDCTTCHGGDNTANSRLLAHVSGFAAIATAETCDSCHSTIVASAANGLHTTLGGYNTILMQRGFDINDPDSAARFEAQCTKCHTAVVTGASAATACGQCHISVPATAGGGLISGHSFNQTPSMDNNCSACHGSRVKDEYYGLNNALLERNKAVFAADSPWDGDLKLAPDVHKTAGLTCMNCHSDAAQSGDEMHGVGHPLPDVGDRYDVSTAPQCTDCHGSAQDTAFNSVSMHGIPDHINSMDCQVCHALPYKNCFSCHTDVSAEGLGFFRINGEDPTHADCRIAVPTAATDALMTFQAGKNPRFGEVGMKEYGVLRHVPVDKDVFQYSGVNAPIVDGIIPPTDGIPATVDMGSLPTWKYATPHTIARSTPITSACGNCHGADYNTFWLTDTVDAAQGWVPVSSPYLQGELDANSGIILSNPLPQ